MEVVYFKRIHLQLTSVERISISVDNMKRLHRIFFLLMKCESYFNICALNVSFVCLNNIIVDSKPLIKEKSDIFVVHVIEYSARNNL